MLNLTQKFMYELSQSDVVNFRGVAQILRVRIADENEEVRPFPDVFADVMKAYDEAGRKRKKELLKILREANKFKLAGGLNGTKDTETTNEMEEV